MTKYATTRYAKPGRFKRLWIIGVILLVLAIGSILFVRQVYTQSLRPVSNDQRTSIFTIDSGSSVKTIAGNLEAKHFIRSAWALELYVHSKELGGRFQAGTYALAPSSSTQQIVTTLTKGKVATRLVTILPGRRIDQVRADLINDGFAPDAVDKALQPDQYADLPALAFKPAGVTSLEGLLWPDSYQKDGNTSPTLIIRQSLVATGDHLTADVQAAFAAQGLTAYQGLTLASIVEQEVSKPADQAQAAQVFLSRLKNNMMLGSDVTAFYGSVAAGKSPSLTYDSSYNTLIHPGLPPTPISSITNESLQAVTHPANTDWVYFVAGDDGTTYFAKTLEDHEANTAKYCHKLCAAP